MPSEDITPDPELHGEVCVVTGGASGIGLAMAHRFAAAGMKVVLADVEQDVLDGAVTAWPGEADRVDGVVCDVRSAEAMVALATRAAERFGDVHVVCLNAGVAPTGSLVETLPEVWDWVLDVNVRGIVNGIRAFVPAMAERGRGHVVITASAAGVTDTPTVGAYGASKHAAVGIAAALRNELADTGVGVSVVCPGLIDTRIFESERNRPVGMADPSEDNPTSKGYRELLAAAGAPPAQVAAYAHRAVLDRQFFVFPTSDFDAGIEGRLDMIRAGLAWRDEVAPTI